MVLVTQYCVLIRTKFGFREDTSVYGLQEDFVAEQLFQSSEHALDDLLWTDHSVLSSIKVLNPSTLRIQLLQLQNKINSIFLDPITCIRHSKGMDQHMLFFYEKCENEDSS